MSDKNLQMAYDIAMKAGIQNLGDFDSFKKGIKNPKNLNTFYGLLQQSKVQNLGSLEEFSMRLSPDKSFLEKIATKAPEGMGLSDVKDWETAWQYGAMLGEKLGNWWEKPLVEPSKLVPEKEDQGVGRGLVRGGVKLAEGLTSPLNALLMLTGGKLAMTAVGKAAPFLFGGMMAKGAVQEAAQFKKHIDNKDYGKAAEVGVLALGDAAFAGLGIKHGIKNAKLRKQMNERLRQEMEDAFSQDAEFEVVESKQLPQAGPEVTPRIGPRQGIPPIDQLPPAGTQPGGLPPGPGTPPRIGPRQGLPETRQLPYRAEGGPIVTPAPEGTQGTFIIPQSWMDQADRIRNFVEARNQEIVQRPPLRNEVQPSPTPTLVPPQPTGSLQKVEAAPVSASKKPKTKKGVEVPPPVKSNIPSSYQTLYDRGFNEDQVFRMSGPGMATILERGWTAEDVSISPKGVVKYVGEKKQLPKINKEVTSSDLGIEKVGDFDTRTYDYIFNELKKGTEDAISARVNPNDYLSGIKDKLPEEVSQYVDKFKEEMGYEVAEGYKGFMPHGEDIVVGMLRGSNAVETITRKMSDIKSGKVSPPDINGAFAEAKPILDQAWTTAKRSMIPPQEFVDSVLEVIPKEAHPILRRWLWSADDVTTRTFDMNSKFIDSGDSRIVNYISKNMKSVDWERYQNNRQLVKIAANVVASYQPQLMKFVRNVELIPFEVQAATHLGRASAQFDPVNYQIGIKEGQTETIPDVRIVNGKEVTVDKAGEDIPFEDTNSLLREYIKSIAHEAKHMHDFVKKEFPDFEKLFEGPYETRKGEIRARVISRSAEKQAMGGRSDYFSKIADAIQELGKGLNEILKGMFEVAGTIGAFSEESYNRAKPHFINAWKIFRQANRPFFDFKNEMIRQFGNAVVPYIDRFGMDIGLTPGPNRAMAANPQVSVSQSTIKKFVEGIKKFGEGFDVEAPFKRQGAAKTGEAIKNWFSTRAYHEEQAIHVWGKKLRELIKENPEDMAHVVLEYENPGWADQNVAAGNRNLVKAAAQEFGRYFQESQSDYRNKGVNIDFKQRLLEDLDALIQKSAGDPATLASLNETRNAINDMNFVHIPSSIWFTQSLLDVDPARGAKTLKLLAAKKRNTFTIKQLLEEGLIDISDVNPFHIIASYARRKGRDMAALDIVNAGKADGFVLDKNAVTGTMFRDIPGYVAPMFSRYKVHPLLADWIYDLRSADYPKTKVGRLIEQTFNYTKAAAFYNPAIMSSNNLVQAVMLGYLRSPLQWKWLGRGMKDAFTRSPEYWKALDLGVASEPMNMPFRDVYQALDKMSQFGNPKVVDMLKKMLPHNALKSIYKLSQDITWQIDRGFRVAGYRYGVEKLGLTPAEAARLSAQFFGDYASVPPKTRRKLNKILFTPTYKIVMGKLYGKMIKGVITGAKDLWRHDKTTRAYAKGLFAMLGVSIAADAVMRLAGFDRDEWGRRYTKEIDTEAGPKELVVTWGTPANMFTKYVARAFESAKKSDVGSTWIASFFNKNKFELHPVYQLALKLADNKNNDGDQIYSPFDATWMKAGKGLLFATTNTIRILELGEEAIRPETEGVEKKPKTFKLLSDEFGMLAALAMEPFTFNYTRGTKTDRIMRRFNYVKAKFQQEIEKGTVDPVKLKNYQKILEDIIKEESK